MSINWNYCQDSLFCRLRFTEDLLSYCAKSATRNHFPSRFICICLLCMIILMFNKMVNNTNLKLGAHIINDTLTLNLYLNFTWLMWREYKSSLGFDGRLSVDSIRVVLPCSTLLTALYRSALAVFRGRYKNHRIKRYIYYGCKLLGLQYAIHACFKAIVFVTYIYYKRSTLIKLTLFMFLPTRYSYLVLLPFWMLLLLVSRIGSSWSTFDSLLQDPNH